MKNLHSRKILSLTGLLSLAVSSSVLATNGMNLEGYGPEAHAMGGASMAYDNGTAAVMNNPATLGFMDKSRLDVALGFLGPDVTSGGADSSGDGYFMPALGYINRSGPLAFGVAMFSQGGMGTEYDGSSPHAQTSDETVRSEVGVGRLIAPLAFKVNSKLSLGATLDLVWAGMDIKMALSGTQFGDLVTPGQQTMGRASGSLVASIGAFGLPVNFARFDFSDGSPFTGEAKGTGFAGKIGAMFQVNNRWAIGATYHTKTSLDDLETDNARLTANVDASGAGFSTRTPMTLSGKMIVKDFQWPETIAAGTMYKVNNQLSLVADLKLIRWSEVMKDFNMSFIASQSSSNDFSAVFGAGADLRGQSMDATLYQNWDDQTVLLVGGAYQLTPNVVLRGGYNYSSNPVPDQYMNPLFPAIVEHHLTMGTGYAIDQRSAINFSLGIGLESSVDNAAGETTHSQTNWQLSYSYFM